MPAKSSSLAEIRTNTAGTRSYRTLTISGSSVTMSPSSIRVCRFADRSGLAVVVLCARRMVMIAETFEPYSNGTGATPKPEACRRLRHFPQGLRREPQERARGQAVGGVPLLVLARVFYGGKNH